MFCCFCVFSILIFCVFFFFKQKTAYEMRISDWSSDVCSSDLHLASPSTWRPTSASPLYTIVGHRPLTRPSLLTRLEMNSGGGLPVPFEQAARDRKSVV